MKISRVSLKMGVDSEDTAKVSFRLNYYPNTDKHRLRYNLTDEEKEGIMKLLNANPISAGFIMKTLKLEVPMKILTDFLGKTDEIETTDSTPKGYRLRNSVGDNQESLF